MSLTLYPVHAICFELMVGRKNEIRLEIMIEYDKVVHAASQYRGEAWVRTPDLLPETRVKLSEVFVKSPARDNDQGALQEDLLEAVLGDKTFREGVHAYLTEIYKQQSSD